MINKEIVYVNLKARELIIFNIIMEPENRENLNAIETFRMKKLFKRLESAKMYKLSLM